MVRKLGDRTVSRCGEQRMTIIKMHDRGALSILVSCVLRVKAQVECSPGLDSYSDLRANASTDVVKDVIEVVESVFGDTITEDGTAEV